MAGLFSFFSAASPKENVEAILAELDETIRTTQIGLTEIKSQRNYYSGTMILYLGLGYMGYVGVYAMLLRDPILDTWRESASKLVPVLLIPVIIYYVRMVCDIYFDKQLVSQNSRLNALVEKKKLKIEEVKRSASYYTTKNILERYGDGQRKMMDRPPPKPQQQLSPPPPQQQQQMREPMRQRPLAQQLGVQRQAPPPQASLKQYASNPSLKKPVPSQSLRTTSSTRWLDRIVDAIVGEEKAPNQFALICLHCRSHNGLVSDAEYDAMSYNCPKCSRFNPSRRSLRRQNSSQGPRPNVQPQMARSMTSHVQKKQPKKSTDATSDNERSNQNYDSEEADAASDDSGFVERRRREKQVLDD